MGNVNEAYDSSYIQVSLYDTSSQAVTIQILHERLNDNCARHADLGYEGIWTSGLAAS